MLTHQLIQKKKAKPSGQGRPVPFISASPAQQSVLRKAIRGEPDTTVIPVGPANDKYEQEADRVAEQVMRMPDPEISHSSEPTLQRMAEEPEEDIEDDRIQRQTLPEPEEEIEDTVQRMPDPTASHSSEPILQRKANCSCGGSCSSCRTNMENPPELMRKASSNESTSFSAPSIVSDVVRSPGQPLDTATRSFMEPRFGHDFSQVRVHTDTQAAESARAVNAQAYTLGNHMVFGEGRHSPESSNGQRLLAHELTHVVQQGAGRTNGNVQQQASNGSIPIGSEAIGDRSSFQRIQRVTDPLSDMSTFQSPGTSGWRGATWGCYRSNCTKKHKGWDVHAAVGTECKATVAGTTSHATQSSGGYGKYVILTSSADATKKYIYAHMGSRETAGSVAEGGKVGEVGTSGNASSTKPHLHFTLKESGTKVDPDGKGFTKPTKVIGATGSTATVYNSTDPDPCTPCAM
ncbi:MAG: DUF4157 domain-containing protein [Anaerolineales bacterium]